MDCFAGQDINCADQAGNVHLLRHNVSCRLWRLALLLSFKLQYRTWLTDTARSGVLMMRRSRETNAIESEPRSMLEDGKWCLPPQDSNTGWGGLTEWLPAVSLTVAIMSWLLACVCKLTTTVKRAALKVTEDMTVATSKGRFTDEKCAAKLIARENKPAESTLTVAPDLPAYVLVLPAKS